MVPCPVDCELSEWSDWSECSVTCGSGMQVRVRSILTEPADGGRKCPLLDGSIKVDNSIMLDNSLKGDNSIMVDNS